MEKLINFFKRICNYLFGKKYKPTKNLYGDTKEQKDFCEEYGCLCCGGGYLHSATHKWFYKMADMIDYVKGLVVTKESATPEIEREKTIGIPLEIPADKIHAPERQENESFEHYKERRKIYNKRLKQHQHGKLVFNSQNIIFDKGKPKNQFAKGRTFQRTKSK